MKRNLFFSLLMIFAFSAIGQQELLVNGGFSLPVTQWSGTSSSQFLNNYSGGNYCSQSPLNYYNFFGDAFEQAGANGMIEGIYQGFSIPSNSSSVTLTFKMSINTLETDGSYDFINVNILSSNGSYIQTLMTLDNTYGTYGIPGCSPWYQFTASIPSAYFGQSLQLSFQATTDNIYPTIFRIDDVSLLAITQAPCTYVLSSSNYTCPNSNAGNYNAISTVSTQSGCSWSATVLTGASWLSTSSQGTGSGSLGISVTQNSSSNSRTGTISVGGQVLTITQPGGGCTYSITPSSYICPNSSAGNLNSIALVNTQGNCNWTATVTSGSSWMVCSSSGIGSGSINITVLENTSSTPRMGTIAVGDQTFTITQPGGDCIYLLSTDNYVCMNSLAGNLSSIALVNTQASCPWSAAVTSGGSWLACSSSSNGSGSIDIVVLENMSPTSRTGTINIEGENLSIVQPGTSVSVVEISESKDLLFYPNPAFQGILVINSKSEKQVLQIMNGIGQIVKSELLDSGKNTIDLTELSNGVYFIQLGDSKVEKLIVN